MSDGREDAYTRTRRSLHGLAELVLAGPRYRQGGSIRLRVQPLGFRTRDEPFVAMRGPLLVADDNAVDVDGLTFAQAAASIGLEASRLDDVYSDGPGVNPDDVIRVDPESVRQLAHALTVGDQALRLFQRSADPILWPEHFDVAIEIGESTYGVSPGDRYVGGPYAYVSRPEPPKGEFWDQPFGAARRLAELDGVEGVVAFFREGSRLGA